MIWAAVTIILALGVVGLWLLAAVVNCCECQRELSE